MVPREQPMLSRAMRAARSFIAVLMGAVISSAYGGPASAGPNLATSGGFEATSSIAGSGCTRSGFLLEDVDFFVDTSTIHAHSGSHSFAGGALGARGFISQQNATTPEQKLQIGAK
jgi:hypothetical protein